MRRTVWALGAAILVAASPAFAGGGATGDVEINGYGGYSKLDDYVNLKPKAGPIIGGRLGFWLTQNLSLEASGQRITTHPDNSPDVDLHFDAFRGNLLFNLLPSSTIRPFITGGGGYESVQIPNLKRNWNFAWNAGAGVRIFPNPMWNIRLDGRFVGTKPDNIDQMQTNYEGSLGIGFLFGGGMRRLESAHAEAANQPPTVTCSADRASILPGESVAVHATASDPDGDPLTYEWSTTAGRVTGTDANATLDFTGVTAPSNATVTVRVSDNHGHTATCESAIAMAEAPKPSAQAVSCLAGGFPRNLSRLNNVDKACLDDVAERLKADPRATVTVIGYADSHERTADEIAEARARAVRDYLTRERSIEASRITVRSAGSTKPIDTATDLSAQGRNRRVEVWFVPEGATIPEQ